jgi:serralysin
MTIFYGSSGNDTITGSQALDTAVFGGNKAQYTIGRTMFSGVWQVSGPDGTDQLLNIERLAFDDVSVALDFDAHAGQAWRLYQLFDRAPDLAGLGYQMHDLDIGVPLVQVAGNFIASPEFQAGHGNLDDLAFLTLLYRNVLHREPDAAGLQYHLDEFARGDTRAMMLTHFTESPENQAAVMGSIEDGMVYRP